MIGVAVPPPSRDETPAVQTAPGKSLITLRSAPIRQLARFATSGTVVAVLYLSATTILITVGVNPQIALVVGYLAGLTLHFTLNRQFVFVSAAGFTHRLSTQATRYLIAAGVAYAITAVALATLPAALGVSDIAVFIAVTLVVALVNFVVLRSWVFHETQEDR